MSNYLFEKYGTKIDTLDMSIPEPIRRTSNNKVRSIETLNKIEKLAGEMVQYVKHIPELDDEKHAALVNELFEATYRAYDQLFDARWTGVK